MRTVELAVEDIMWTIEDRTGNEVGYAARCPAINGYGDRCKFEVYDDSAESILISLGSHIKQAHLIVG